MPDMSNEIPPHLKEIANRAELLKKCGKEAIRIIVHSAPKATVYCFGSYAKNELHAYSDIDFLVDSGIKFTNSSEVTHFSIDLINAVFRTTNGLVEIVMFDPFHPKADKFVGKIADHRILIVDQGEITKDWR
jgi:predicted nucleotidyltransferase